MSDYGVVENPSSTGGGRLHRRLIAAVATATVLGLVLSGTVLLGNRETSRGPHRPTTANDLVIVLRPDVTVAQLRALVQDLSTAAGVKSFHLSAIEPSPSLLPCHLPACGPGFDTIREVPSGLLRSLIVVPTDAGLVPLLVNRFERVPGVLRASP
jgi:hypothetical protein